MYPSFREPHHSDRKIHRSGGLLKCSWPLLRWPWRRACWFQRALWAKQGHLKTIFSLLPFRRFQPSIKSIPAGCCPFEVFWLLSAYSWCHLPRINVTTQFEKFVLDNFLGVNDGVPELLSEDLLSPLGSLFPELDWEFRGVYFSSLTEMGATTSELRKS